jgi:hypothetical protein
VSSACHKKESVKGDEQWSAKMQEMRGQFTQLMPYIYSEKAFLAPENEKEIAPLIQSLENTTRKISHETVKEVRSADPGFRFVANRLDTELIVAQETFESGNKEYSRRLLKNVVKNCFYCHSQTNQGPRFDNIQIEVNNTDLNRTERADLLVAMRNYKGALKELENVLTDKQYLQSNPFEQERALRKYLALSIRVNNDPAEARKLMQKLLKSDVKPIYLQDHIKAWEKSLAKWERELKSSKKKKAGGLKEARRLVKQAQVVQEFPVDNSGDVYYLRATNLLHDYLAEEKKKTNAIEALYLLGSSYEVLANIGLWDMSDVYYEACIRQSPHTTMAERCFKRWEQNMYLGYSGSGGIFIPKTVRTRMSELKELAKPLKK